MCRIEFIYFKIHISAFKRTVNNAILSRWRHDQKIFLDEEKITKLIKEVFEEELKKQEVNITNISSSNFTLTMKEIKSLKQEVNDLKESIEFTQNDLEEKVADVEKKISTFEIKVNERYDYRSTPIMSMIVCQNCKKRYRRWKTGLVETTYEQME